MLVPKKGLEPPHPCGYMDLNHARLPIPPLRHEVRAATRDRGALLLGWASFILPYKVPVSNLALL